MHIAIATHLVGHCHTTLPDSVSGPKTILSDYAMTVETQRSIDNLAVS